MIIHYVFRCIRRQVGMHMFANAKAHPMAHFICSPVKSILIVSPMVWRMSMYRHVLINPDNSILIVSLMVILD